MAINLADYGIDRLSRDEKIELVQALWNSIAASNEPMPLSDRDKVELNRRIEAYERNPDDVLPWEQVRAQLNAKFGRSSELPPLTEELKAELDRRLEAHARNPQEGISGAELTDRAIARAKE